MYNKLFTKILDSSIWLEDMPTRIVWLTLIAAMDEQGFCQFAAVGNLANRARVTLDECRKAITYLEGPDGESSDPDNDGRRIERVPGGWMVLNSSKYRDMVTRVIIQAQTKARVQKHRALKRPVTVSNAVVTPSDTDTRSDTTTEKIKPSRASRSSAPTSFDEFWLLYPKKTGKQEALKAWTKAQPNIEQVKTALRWQTQQPNWIKDQGRFVPNPSTWINQHRWDDEPFHVPVKESSDEQWKRVLGGGGKLR